MSSSIFEFLITEFNCGNDKGALTVQQVEAFSDKFVALKYFVRFEREESMFATVHGGLLMELAFTFLVLTGSDQFMVTSPYVHPVNYPDCGIGDAVRRVLAV